MSIRIITKAFWSKQISPDDFATGVAMKTFVIKCPELEALLFERKATVIGAEIIDLPTNSEDK